MIVDCDDCDDDDDDEYEDGVYVYLELISTSIGDHHWSL